MTVSEIKQKATELKKEIESMQKKIDNPSLYISTISALDFFIENIESE